MDELNPNETPMEAPVEAQEDAPEQTGRTPREKLQELHGVLCDRFLDYAKNTPPGKIRASMIEVIRGFLKDNGITKNLAQAKDVAASLEELSDIGIPFLPDYLN